MRRILLFQWFEPKTALRMDDFSACAKHNLQLGFDQIVIFNAQEPAFVADTIRNVPSSTRIEFRDFVDLIVASPEGTKICATNSDIQLDAKIFDLMDVIVEGQMACISRYEKGGKLFPAAYGSQDTWVCASQSLHNSIVVQSRLPFGVPGCDNRFAEICFGAGMDIFNPCLSVRNLHIHDEEQSHSDRDRLYGAYLFLPPCSLEDVVAKQSKMEPYYVSARHADILIETAIQINLRTTD